MRVEKLIKSQHVADRFYAALENGESIKVDINIIADLSLYAGRELTDEELNELQARSGAFEAKERALKLLSSRQMSRKELKKKLAEKGATDEAADAAADIMERIGAVNDAEYAASIVRHYAKMGYGAGRIRQELMRRGVDKELWDDALSEMPEGGDKLDELIARRLKGRDPDEKELKRLTDRLIRRGFSWSEVRAALARYNETLELEETE